MSMKQVVMYTVIYEAEAIQDLQSILEYYAKEVSLAQAETMNEKITASIATLQEMPLRCPKTDFTTHDDIRKMSLIGLPYLAYFLVNEDAHQVNVLRIVHGSRQQPAVISDAS